MAYCSWLRQTTKRTTASLVVASLVLFAPHGMPAARSRSVAQNNTPAGAGMCEFTGKGKYYYSAIFDVPNGDDRYKWEIAWGSYIHNQVDPFPGNGYCQFYRTRAAAQHDLQVHKNQAGAKLIETGWVYTGPE